MLPNASSEDALRKLNRYNDDDMVSFHLPRNVNYL